MTQATEQVTEQREGRSYPESGWDVDFQARLTIEAGWEPGPSWDFGLRDPKEYVLDVPDYCIRCGRQAGPYECNKDGCRKCEHEQHFWGRIYRLDGYTRPIPEWIRRMKYAGDWSWAKWFGTHLGRHYLNERARLLALRAKRDELAKQYPEVAAENIGSPDTGEDNQDFAAMSQLEAMLDLDENETHAASTLVTFVPTYRWRKWKRGFNQAEQIARAFAEYIDRPCGPLLFRKGASRRQVKQSDRTESPLMQAELHAAPVDLSGYHIILVDDVKTSGKTLRHCTRMLKRMGCDSLDVAVVAVAD